MQCICAQCGKQLFLSEPGSCPYCGYNEYISDEQREIIADLNKQIMALQEEIGIAEEQCFNQRKSYLESEFKKLCDILVQLEGKVQSYGIFKFTEKKKAKQEIECIKNAMVENSTQIMLLPDYADMIHNESLAFIKRCRDMVNNYIYHCSVDNGKVNAEFTITPTVKENRNLVPYVDCLLKSRTCALTLEQIIEMDHERRLVGYRHSRIQAILYEVCKQGLAMCIQGYKDPTQRGSDTYVPVEKVYLSTQLANGIPTLPTVDAFINKVSNVTIQSIRIEKQNELQDRYDSYIKSIALELGLMPIYESLMEVTGRLIRKQAVNQMSALANAGAALNYSKHYDPALLGGLTNALAGPVSGILVAHQAVVTNMENTVKRKKSELNRDEALKVATALNEPVRQMGKEIDDFQTKLIMVHEGKWTIFDAF